MKCSMAHTLLAIFIYHVQILTVAVHVVISKNGKDCNGKDLPTLLFDDDHIETVTVSSRCPMTTFVEVFLEGPFIINFVIVYEGKDVSKGDLNFFLVERGAEGLYERCSEYSGTSKSNAITGLRVNCDASNKMFSKVKVESRKNKGIKIAELEVHTFGSGVPGERAFINRGCFRRFDGKANTVESPELQNCQLECSKTGIIFFAIKNNRICVCGNNYNESMELTANFCDIKCEDDKRYCGGADAFNVYLSLPWLPSYIGCYKLVHNTKVVELEYVETVEKCLRRCVNHFYALLEEGSSCYCKNELSGNITKYTNCRTKCVGDNETICGGKGYVSVYGTCLKPTYPSMICPKLLKCEMLYDLYGSCSGRCEKGFTGQHCLERQRLLELKMTCEAMDPCLKVKNSKCVESDGGGVCECHVGYVMNNLTGDCEAIQTSTTVPTTTTTTTTTTPTTTTTASTVQIATYVSTTKAITDTRKTEAGESLCLGGSNKCVGVPNTVCVVVSGSETCECRDGYSRNSKTDECKDLNDDRKDGKVSTEIVTEIAISCSSPNLCTNQANTYCVSLNGNDICECNLGYTRDKTSQHCEDIDECTMNPCDSRYTNCVNLNGSYYCKCKPGFTRATKEICLANHTDAIESDWAVRFAIIKRYGAYWLYMMLPFASVFIMAVILFLNIPPRSSESTSDAEPTESELNLYKLQEKIPKRNTIALFLKQKKGKPNTQDLIRDGVS